MSVAKSLLKAFNQKPIVIYPVYIKITGDHASAAALAQIIYWHDLNGGEFYKTDVDFEAELSLKKDQFLRVKKVLKTLKFLSIKLRQVPAKTFYSVDDELLATEITRAIENPSLWEKPQTGLCENPQTRLREKPQAVLREKPQTGLCENPQSNTENTNREYTEINNINKGHDGKTHELKSVDKFVPPTVEDVKKYADEINAVNFDAAVFVDYYKANGWMVGKNKMKDWRATVRNWLRRGENQQRNNQPDRKDFTTPAQYIPNPLGGNEKVIN